MNSPCTSVSEFPVPILNISQLKLHVRAVILNINKLEALYRLEANHIDIGPAQLYTESLLNNLESQPKVIQSVVRQRLKKRTKCKAKALDKKKKAKISIIPISLNIPAGNSCTDDIPQKKSEDTHTRKITKDAKRFLETFELLEDLHKLKSGNAQSVAEFVENLKPLHSIWQKILQHNSPSQSFKEKLQQEWNEVLFGCYAESKNSATKKNAFKEFLTKRRIWDSYLVKKNRGSFIPLGWICPKKYANEKWAKYKRNIDSF